MRVARVLVACPVCRESSAPGATTPGGPLTRAGVFLHGQYESYSKFSFMTTPDLVVLGAALRVLRARAGCSQAELAARVELDKPYLSRVEGGHRDIRWSMLTRLLDGLDASLADLERAVAEVEASIDGGR